MFKRHNVLIFDTKGRVLKVDGAYAAVRFPTSKENVAKDKENNANSGGDDIVSLLQDCRLMRKDDLQVMDHRVC